MDPKVKVAFKTHLLPDSCVPIRSKMLAYYRVRSGF